MILFFISFSWGTVKRGDHTFSDHRHISQAADLAALPQRRLDRWSHGSSGGGCGGGGRRGLARADRRASLLGVPRRLCSKQWLICLLFHSAICRRSYTPVSRIKAQSSPVQSTSHPSPSAALGQMVFVRKALFSKQILDFVGFYQYPEVA